MLSAENLRKAYAGRPAVDGVSLTVARGEIVGLLGPNGAGKTTTFCMLIGRFPPDGGTVSLNGDDITALPMYARARRGLVYLPQESSVFAGLSVADNLRAVLEFLPLDRPDRERRCRQALERLGLAALADRRAGTLSGGERRRLEIARSLVLDPSFLLLDEPFSGVDPLTIEDLRLIIAGLAAEGIGILITDHNVRDTLAITSRAYLVFQGRVLFAGTGPELVGNPAARRFYLGDGFTL